jgi:NhaP-type Na+/H+ or K+/H+ antiporter
LARLERDEEDPSMPIVELLLVLLFAVALLAFLAGRIHLPYPIVLVLGGLALGFLPDLPTIALQPELIFLLFLPLLLYADAWSTSWRDFRFNLRSISLLAIGLVIATTLIVAVVAHAVLPHFSWAAAFVFPTAAAQAMWWQRTAFAVTKRSRSHAWSRMNVRTTAHHTHRHHGWRRA